MINKRFNEFYAKPEKPSTPLPQKPNSLPSIPGFPTPPGQSGSNTNQPTTTSIDFDDDFFADL